MNSRHLRAGHLLHFLALAIAGACGTAQAADKSARYMVLAPKAPAALAKAMGPVQRASQLRQDNAKTASGLAAVGAEADGQLQSLAPISFAELSDTQVAALRAKGYAVAPVGSKQLLGDDQVQADTVPYGIAKLRAPESWGETKGNGVKVCVIDTGVDYNHPDLAANFVEGVSTVGAGGPDPMDVHGHGSHVAGTIAAAMNGSDVVGVAPEARIYAAAVFGPGGTATDEDILEGLDWCAGKGTPIFSMSYGGGASTPVEEAAYQAAHNAGILLVAAAGNSGPSVPIGFPARYPFVVAVGATDTNDAIASFSQRGPELDVTAPGVAVLSDKLGGGTTLMSGTSMATPHVSGVAAALLGAHPGLTNTALADILGLTATDLGTAGFDTTFGHGRIDLRAALDYAATGNLPPTAAFTATVLTSDPLSALFTDKSSDPNGDAIVSRHWAFGDGTSSTETRPRHRFPSAGDYSVVLTVSDARGASRSLSKLVKVGPPSTAYLSNGVPVADLAGAAGSVRKYRLRVPAGAENLSIRLSGGTGDADLYVRYAAEPTASTFDCRPYLDGNNERCDEAAPSTGVYYIQLVGYTAYSGAQLVASYDAVGSSGPSFENATDYAIPDDDENGVESPIAVSRSGTSNTVKVKLSILHSFVGDLVVDLVSPAGTVYNLHNRTGGAQVNLNAIYNVALGSEDSAGQWRLRVRDLAFADTGYIDRWSLGFAN